MRLSCRRRAPLVGDLRKVFIEPYGATWAEEDGVMLDDVQVDRARGVLLGCAVGDALGAGYEFGPPLGPGVPIRMKGGGPFGFEPGEWTDDTAMTLAIALALRESGSDLHLAADRTAESWLDWSRSTKDIGVQTSAVFEEARRLAAAQDRATVRAEDLLTAARTIHERTGKSGGNGSLMRTSPLALVLLGADDDELVEVVRYFSRLTHRDDDAWQACVLWTDAIRRAVRTGRVEVRAGLGLLPADAAAAWSARLDAAEEREPRDFPRNGWVVEALQGAWSALSRAGAPDEPHFVRRACELAVRGGADTDTVAAITGALAGAAAGRRGIADEDAERVHGWPGLRAADLVDLADALTAASRRG
jgi:ADP-ribosyl-[dinitrogen reductase] hydrolase